MLSNSFLRRENREFPQAPRSYVGAGKLSGMTLRSFETMSSRPRASHPPAPGTGQAPEITLVKISLGIENVFSSFVQLLRRLQGRRLSEQLWSPSWKEQAVGPCFSWAPDNPGTILSIMTLQFAHLLNGNNSRSRGQPVPGMCSGGAEAVGMAWCWHPCFLEPSLQRTICWATSNHKHLFSPGSGGQMSKIKVWAGPCHLGRSWGRVLPRPLQLWCLPPFLSCGPVAPASASAVTQPPPLLRVFSVGLCLISLCLATVRTHVVCI